MRNSNFIIDQESILTFSYFYRTTRANKGEGIEPRNFRSSMFKFYQYLECNIYIYIYIYIYTTNTIIYLVFDHGRKGKKNKVSVNHTMAEGGETYLHAMQYQLGLLNLPRKPNAQTEPTRTDP